MQDSLIGVPHLGQGKGSSIKRQPRHILRKHVSVTMLQGEALAYTVHGRQASNVLSRLHERREPFVFVPVAILRAAQLADADCNRSQSRFAGRRGQDLLANPLRFGITLHRHDPDGLIDVLLNGVSWGIRLCVYNQ